MHRGVDSEEEVALADLSDKTYFIIEVVGEERLQGQKISSFLFREDN